MRLFKRKPKPPLAEAFRLANQATEVAWLYLRDKQFVPSEEELRLLQKLAETLWGNQQAVLYIIRCLRERLPEDALH